MVFLISILISIILGFVTSFFFTLTPFQSFVAGLLSLIAFTLLQLSTYALESLNRASDHHERLIQMESLIGFDSHLKQLDNDPFLKTQVVNLVRNANHTVSSLLNQQTGSALDRLFTEELLREVTHCGQTLEQLQNGTLRVVGDEAHMLWSKVLKATETSFFTTNIFRFRGVLLGSRDSQHLLEIQNELAQRLGPKQVERLFVYEPDDEPKVDKIIRSQRSIGIEAWKVSRAQFDRLSADGNWVEKIGSEDFSIVDDRFLYLTTIDFRTGRVLYVDLYRGGVRLSAALEFATRIRDIERLFKKDDIIEIPTESPAP